MPNYPFSSDVEIIPWGNDETFLFSLSEVFKNKFTRLDYFYDVIEDEEIDKWLEGIYVDYYNKNNIIQKRSVYTFIKYFNLYWKDIQNRVEHLTQFASHSYSFPSYGESDYDIWEEINYDMWEGQLTFEEWQIIFNGDEAEMLKRFKLRTV